MSSWLIRTIRAKLWRMETWPALPLEEWEDTRATLHMWTQIVGKIRLEQTPLVNHWWNVPLYVSARGLTTTAMPYEERFFEMAFDFIVCDSPAGIETGALMALYFADEAIITTNPEVSSVRDSDRILGIISSKSRRAETSQEPVKEHLLLTRYNPGRVSRGDMLSMEDVLEILRIPLVGVIPEDQSVLRASNQGEPVILDGESDAGKAYADTVDRLLGESRPFRFIEEEKKGFLKRLFGG